MQRLHFCYTDYCLKLEDYIMVQLVHSAASSALGVGKGEMMQKTLPQQ